MILIGDIGGTKTSLSIFETEWTEDSIFDETYINSDFGSFYELIEKTTILQYEIDNVVLGIAGPVAENKVKMTNLNWSFSEKQLSSLFNTDNIKLLNDLEAIAYGLITPQELKPKLLYGVDGSDELPKNLIAVGTGLGMSFLTGGRDLPVVNKTEGGHILFSPRNKHERAVLDFMQDIESPVTYERVCSSIGIINLLKYYLQTQSNISEGIRSLIEKEDPSREIIENFNSDGTDSVVKKIITDLYSILGSYLGNIGFLFIPKGGIYLAGGVIQNSINDDLIQIMLDSFLDRGKMKNVISKLPIYLIQNRDPGRVGCLNYVRYVFN